MLIPVCQISGNISTLNNINIFTSLKDMSTPVDQIDRDGDIAQLVEHSLSVQGVPGSNPGGPNKRNLSLPSAGGVKCSARLKTSLGLNSVSEGK